MGSLESVAKNDITRYKNNLTGNEEVSTSEIKKKLYETIETNQLIQMLDATKKGEKSPVEAMNELGFNIKDITGGLKDNVELYKGLVETEIQKRNKVEEQAQEAKSQVFELREKLIESTIMQQMEKFNSAITDIMKKVEEKKPEEKKDPVNDVANQLALKLLNEKIEDLTEKKNHNPIQDIFDALETYEQLKGRFKPQETEIPTDANKINIELIKLKLQDDRERAIEEKKLKLDQEKQETIKYALNTIGAELADAIGAFASAMSQPRENSFSTGGQIQAQPQAPQGIQGIPYQCEKCNEIFVLHRAYDNAICPYCGHGK
jgi:hypothetical protein